MGHYSLGNVLLCSLHWKKKKKTNIQHETNYLSEERQGEIEKEKSGVLKNTKIFWKEEKSLSLFGSKIVRFFHLSGLVQSAFFPFIFFSISSSFKCTRLNFTVASCRGGIGCFACSANVFCRVTWREETGTNRRGTEKKKKANKPKKKRKTDFFFFLAFDTHRGPSQLSPIGLTDCSDNSAHVSNTTGGKKRHTQVRFWGTWCAPRRVGYHQRWKHPAEAAKEEERLDNNQKISIRFMDVNCFNQRSKGPNGLTVKKRRALSKNIKMVVWS